MNLPASDTRAGLFAGLQSNPRIMEVTTSQLFSPGECSAIIEACDPTAWTGSVVSTAVSDDLFRPERPPRDRDESVRSGYEQPVPGGNDGPWVQRVMARVVEVNDEVYQFSLTRLERRSRVMRYSPGHHFSCHSDLSPATMHRKLGFAVLLSAPDDFEGGDLVFVHSPTPTVRIQGVLTVFPSYLWHEVMPITAGVRHALVGHVEGPTFW